MNRYEVMTAYYEATKIEAQRQLIDTQRIIVSKLDKPHEKYLQTTITGMLDQLENQLIEYQRNLPSVSGAAQALYRMIPDLPDWALWLLQRLFTRSFPDGTH